MNHSDYQLFVDLDGVLVDFDSGVRHATGKDPAELTPRQMWPVLARTTGFYDSLSWMSDGRELWEALRTYSPAILTGLPMGKWAEPQKRSWCSRELGDEIPVITGMSRKKAELALEWLEKQNEERRTPVLIDDRLKIKESWETAGGIFVLHLDAETSLEALRGLSFPV